MSSVLTSTEAPATVTYTFTSESVSEGHPDKVCDFIADSILDAHLEQDPASRVACEVLVKEDRVVLAGEITSDADVDFDALVRRVVAEIGYVDADQPFRPDAIQLHSFLSKQAAEISQGVTAETSLVGEQGAGDQGIMFGYATDETPELMPLPILLAHRLARSLAEHRKAGRVSWLRPDAKTQVSVVYEGNTPVRVTDVLVSTQHSADVDRDAIRHFVATTRHPRGAGRVVPRRPQDPGEPHRELRAGRAVRRRGRHRAQDHRGHLRRRGRVTAAARSAARTRPRWTGAAPTSAASWRARWSRPGSPGRPRCRWRTPSAWRSRSR